MSEQVMSDEAWRKIASLLSPNTIAAGLNPAGGTTTAQPDRQQNFLDAMASPETAANETLRGRGQKLREEIQSLLKQLERFASISRCPILAITGLLNAGKSSLLATYLSPANRPRILRGLSNSSGTHRFILWMPSAWWHDKALFETLTDYLTDLFGHAPERLSDDPIVAAKQYNGAIFPELTLTTTTNLPADNEQNSVEPDPRTNKQLYPNIPTKTPMGVPLIAYDEGLDELRVGLLDCPDIQTGLATAQNANLNPNSATATRQLNLSRFGKLCSAFIVVSKLSSLHDESLIRVLTTLRESMPGVPRLLAVNKVKARYSAEVVRQESRELVERFDMDSVFLAYDYRSARAAEKIPAPPKLMQGVDAADSLPIFFRTTDSEASNSVPTKQTQFLHSLGEQLDAGELSKASCRSLQLQLKAKTLQCIDWFEENTATLTVKGNDARQTIADACFEFMAERDANGHAVELRLQTSPAIIAQIADSLNRTAPYWMRASLKIDRTARQIHQSISDSASRLKILRSASEAVTGLARRFRRGEGAQVVTPQRLAEAIRKCDCEDVFASLDQAQLQLACDHAMRKFAEEDTTRLDDAELDIWSKEVWANMPLKDKLWKSTQPLAVITAPLLAAILIPFDAGGTAVLVFASTKELLAAAGIAAFLGPLGTGGETLKIVHRETPWRQLSDLFALMCDSLGVQRPNADELPTADCGSQSRKLLPSRIAFARDAITVRSIPRCDISPESLQQLKHLAQESGDR